MLLLPIIYLNDDNLEQLNFSWQNMAKDSFFLILNSFHQELDGLNSEKVKIINIFNQDFSTTLLPLLNSLAVDFVLLLKSGEYIDQQNRQKLESALQTNSELAENILILTQSSFFPNAPAIETRMIKIRENPEFEKNIHGFTDHLLISENKPLATIFSIRERKISPNGLEKNLKIFLNQHLLNPGELNYFLHFGLTLVLQGEWENGKKILAKYIQTASYGKEKISALLYQSICHHFLGEQEKSILILETILAEEPDFSPGQIWLGMNFWKNGDFFAAYRSFSLVYPELVNDFERKKLKELTDFCQSEMAKGTKNKPKSLLINQEKPLITAMLAIKNEEKYIGLVLSQLSEYVDSVVILDDASTDKTVEIVKKFPKVKNLYRNPPGLERHEGRDRNRLFQLARETEAQWLITLDGDEIFEPRIKKYLPLLCIDENTDAYFFKIYNFWRSEKFFRIDGVWDQQFRCKLFRNRESYNCFENNKLHVSTIPLNLPPKKSKFSDIRIKHYGYADFSDTLKKYAFYEREDKEKKIALIGRKDYSHLIDESGIRLEEWVD